VAAAGFVPAQFRPAAELPDADYPFVLITGRVLEHWHTGAMTRRSEVLDALEPAAHIDVQPGRSGGAGLAAPASSSRWRRGAGR
jgi:formate dehydrogenase major subunit